MNNPQLKYWFIPTQVLEVDDYVILRKGLIQLKIEGGSALEIIKVIITMASDKAIYLDDIVQQFDGPYQDTVSDMLSTLIEKRFLLEEEQRDSYRSTEINDHNLANFYWSLNVGEEQTNKIQSTRIDILGINHVSLRMAELLEKSGFKNFKLIDYPLLRNLHYFSEENGNASELNFVHARIVSYDAWVDSLESGDFDLLVATSDFGGSYYFRDFNKFCVENNKQFFAVTLQNMKGLIGPFVIPGFTACYECFLQRQNSNQESFQSTRSIELSDYEGQSVSGFHPAMLYALADVAIMEIFKFYSGVLSVQNTGRIIEMNLLKSEMKNRQILKVPRCGVCSGIHRQSSVSVFDDNFMPVHGE